MTVLLWDFFGPNGEGTARHFCRHLDEFLSREGIAGCATGVERLGDGHVAAWCRAPASAASVVARVLRPRRQREEQDDGDADRAPVN